MESLNASAFRVSGFELENHHPFIFEQTGYDSNCFKKIIKATKFGVPQFETRN